MTTQVTDEQVIDAWRRDPHTHELLEQDKAAIVKRRREIIAEIKRREAEHLEAVKPLVAKVESAKARHEDAAKKQKSAWDALAEAQTAVHNANHNRDAMIGALQAELRSTADNGVIDAFQNAIEQWWAKFRNTPAAIALGDAKVREWIAAQAAAVEQADAFRFAVETDPRPALRKLARGLPFYNEVKTTLDVMLKGGD